MLVALLAAVDRLAAADKEPFRLAPAVAVEAEDFTVQQGWRPVRVGEGNYAVDTIGFSHTSGERFLHADAADTTASAFMDVTVPVAGSYRLWVRYEYMPFTESRFRVVVEQDGRTVADKIMGGRENPRVCPWSDGTKLAPQYDPPWGNEGITEEPLDISSLATGSTRIRLLTVQQPKIQGVTANRNIDCLYLTGDVKDAWRRHAPYKGWYGILNAFRDTRGPRYEVQYVNRGDKPLSIAVQHNYNRVPWWVAEPAASMKDLMPGAASPWLPLAAQDISHFSMTRFTPNAAQPLTVSVRPVGGAVEETVQSPGDWVGIYLPTYPGKGEKAIHVNKVLDRVITAVKAVPAPGKVPTLPLCYGSCIRYDEDNDYGRKYARLFALIGMRNTGCPTGAALKNLQAVGLGPTRSHSYMEYRFPPIPENIAKARDAVTKIGALPYLRWFDYGDEIGFGEWFGYMVQQRRKIAKNPDLKAEDVVRPLWQQWLRKNRPGFRPEDYWRPSWGVFATGELRPDASAEAAAEKPKLYVDSIIFYEDVSIEFVAEGVRAVKAALGEQVLCGCNYSCYPYYYAHSVMYVKWFRQGAADFGHHSEYFWQLGQVTPMVNGYVSEHFRAGMRFNPKAIIKQYTMPHSPGNTDASFRRTAFTHLAHGCKNLSFFGIGMNETFTENYIDFRDTGRYIAIRDITHAMALVEDVLEESQVVPSEVALLVSESTERWDHAKVANDHVTKGQPERRFRDDRLTYHQERVGIYTALSFAGYGPDLVVEEDLLNPQVLQGYKVLFVVGDSLPVEAAPALQKWAEAGGVLVATAGAGRYGTYHEPNPAMEQLLGIQARKLEHRDTFLRTSQELPFLRPYAVVQMPGGSMPALATRERITPVADAEVLATFLDDHSPAVIVREMRKGRVYYLAALPGLAYLWTGLQPPLVPDRGPGVHRAVTTYDRAAAALLRSALDAAGLRPRVQTAPDYIDTRLIRGKGAYLLSLANYNQTVGGPVTVTIAAPDGAARPVHAVSAFNGKLELRADKSAWTFTVPKLGYGEIVRISVR